MKYLRLLIIVLFIAALGIGNLSAQILNGMSLNGATGLYSIPTGRIGWGQPSNVALDLGYHAIIVEGHAAHIPKVALNLYRWVELSTAFDIQPVRYFGTADIDGNIDSRRGVDLIGGAKVQFPLAVTSLALGGNFQAINLGSSRYSYNAGQIYLATTYGGLFFNWPAETTMVVGKTFRQNQSNSNIDFGMGFDLVLFPNAFSNYVHWVSDFSNFSYSMEAYGADAWSRGVLNTGIRFDLRVIPVFRRFKFIVDIVVVDALDHNRAFSMGTTFGMRMQ